MGFREANKPLFIIDSNPDMHRAYEKYPISKYPVLNSFITSHYQRDSIFQAQFPEVKYHLYRQISR